MDKKIILSVAGSGKTYTLCKDINITKRNLVIAYTNQNIKNIRTEIKKHNNGTIPQNTLIMTFNSFIYKFLIRPFDPSISLHFNENNFKSNGLTIKKPPEKSLKYKGTNGKFYWKSNPNYHKDVNLKHYIDKSNRYYCTYCSKLIIKLDKKKNCNLFQKAIYYLNNFFDKIYIDEVQDFRKEDWELLSKLCSHFPSILLVGDYYQNSVSGSNNSGIPFDDKTYTDYIGELENIGLEVDTTSLIKSRRCSKDVCDFIKEKLNIEIESEEINHGKVIILDNTEEIHNILSNDNIIKLFLKSPNKSTYKMNYTTWGYSKGDTYEESCIILTKDFENIDLNKYNVNTSTLNKFYVAMTRATGNTYLIKKSTFDKIKDLYIIESN